MAKEQNIKEAFPVKKSEDTPAGPVEDGVRLIDKEILALRLETTGYVTALISQELMERLDWYTSDTIGCEVNMGGALRLPKTEPTEDGDGAWPLRPVSDKDLTGKQVYAQVGFPMHISPSLMKLLGIKTGGKVTVDESDFAIDGDGSLIVQIPPEPVRVRGEIPKNTAKKPAAASKRKTKFISA